MYFKGKKAAVNKKNPTCLYLLVLINLSDTFRVSHLLPVLSSSKQPLDNNHIGPQVINTITV